MRHSLRVAAVLATTFAGYSGAALAQTDPPTRVGRLSFIEGTVSFHDDQGGWSPAVVNTPLTSGDAIWTEPNARSELSVAGTRVRLDNATQLELLAINDSQTRLQVDRGRIDVKTYTLDTDQPYQIVTPRGTISLQAQGDYYVEAGSIEDATRLGVRSGAARIQSLDGQTLAVGPGEVGEISGDASMLQLRTVHSAPPAAVTYWDARDRQMSYAPPAQYLSGSVTGYEDLGAYGSWSNDSRYGNVWTPRSVPSGWQPYRTGHWANVRPWGWTWIDDQPWGYAPYHYGRWANSNNRWVWVPPQRDVQPVYAPALVAFIGGIELAVTLGNATNGPVGWFPLAPHETYVPSYTTDRDYYNRLNRSAQVQQTELDDRWQRTQRHEVATNRPADARANLRFATVVPADVFVRSQPVARAAIAVAPEKLATVPTAIVSTPPAPTASLVPHAAAPAASSGAAPTAAAKPTDPKPPVDARAKADAEGKTKVHANPPANIPLARTAVTDMPTLGTPAKTAPAAPGPKIAPPMAPAAATPGAPKPPAAPALVTRTGPPPPTLKEDKTAPANVEKPAEHNPPAHAPNRGANDNPPRVQPAPHAATQAQPLPPALPTGSKAAAGEREPQQLHPAPITPARELTDDEKKKEKKAE